VATTKQFWSSMKTIRDQIATAMGANLAGSDKALRAAANANLALTAVLAKTLVDNNIITVAQLQATLNGAGGVDGSAWDDEAINP
jgi:hypothetical protein